jgi:catechol 2,3-dioxygenase-like lactoylglutathione lyase family enzyme
MKVTGLGWVGTRTKRAAELSAFYEGVLGLPVVYREEGFWVHELPGGHHAAALPRPRRERLRARLAA